MTEDKKKTGNTLTRGLFGLAMLATGVGMKLMLDERTKKVENPDNLPTKEEYVEAKSLENSWTYLENEKALAKGCLIDEAELRCPLTQKIMTEPYITKYGNNFNYPEIEEYIKAFGEDPKEKKKLNLDEITPNYKLKAKIKKYNKERKEFNLDIF